MLTADYITIPHAPDFLNADFELVLTDVSKELFKLGRPRQGYIGIVELPYLIDPVYQLELNCIQAV